MTLQILPPDLEIIAADKHDMTKIQLMNCLLPWLSKISYPSSTRTEKERFHSFSKDMNCFRDSFMDCELWPPWKDSQKQSGLSIHWPYPQQWMIDKSCVCGSVDFRFPDGRFWVFFDSEGGSSARGLDEFSNGKRRERNFECAHPKSLEKEVVVE